MCPGATIIVEKAHASILLEEFKESHCHHCLHWTLGPVPCHQCSQVTFGLFQGSIHSFLIPINRKNRPRTSTKCVVKQLLRLIVVQ